MKILRQIKKASARTYRQKLLLTKYAFATPQLFLFVLFVIVPFIIAIPILFTDKGYFNDYEIHNVGLANFKALADPAIREPYLYSLKKTLLFVIMNYVNIYIWGLPLALLMYEVGFRGGFFTIIYLPMMVSGLALGYIAVMLFAQSSGTANLLLLDLGILEKAIDIQSGKGVTWIVPLFVGWQFAGFHMAVFLSGLLSIPRETIEAAIVDGANYWQRLFRVYFPQMLPSFLISSIFVFIGSFSLLDLLVALGAMSANAEARFLSVYFISKGFREQQLAKGMTIAIETFLPLFIIGLLAQRLQRRLQY